MTIDTLTQPSSETSSTPPPPTFEVLNLSKETLEALSAMGYTHPTPVQRAVFEPAVRGKDIVVQARTGTGKTAAFGLPIVETVVRRNLAKVQVLVLCPTRELALQVTAELERLGRLRGIRATPIYGGAPMNRQVDQLATGAQVVVGTPGRVLDHLHRKTLDPESIRMLVLDEADEMLSMGFERELSSILERLPKQRQTLLFSATIPADIERIARDRLKEPEFLTLSGDHIGALEVLHFIYLSRGDKLEALLRVLEVENPESAIVFCNTKAETERVAEALERQGFSAAWLNGDLPQNEREQVMQATRQGKLRYLVATDVAARGIDISHLTHVVNFDFPESAERYVHRTGRTGRAGRTGNAISIVAPQDIGHLYLLRLTYKIRPIEKQLPTAGELKTREEADLVQMLADAFLVSPPHPDDVALARRLLSHDAADQIIAGLVRDHLGARPDAVEQAAAARRAKVVPTEGPDGSPRETSAVEGRQMSSNEGAHRARSDEPRSQRKPRLRRERSHRPDQSEARSRHDDDDGLDVKWTIEPGPAAGEGRPATHPSFDDRPRDPTFAEIFVNLGRRDGVSASDFQRVLTDVASISRSETGKIRVRDRSSFVSVKREFLEKAVAALNGATISGKVAQAQPARARSTGTSSPNDG
jgi:ATP-dependent RNA helicase DeaD